MDRSTSAPPDGALDSAAPASPAPVELPPVPMRPLGPIPSVSVLITSYNYGRFLPEAIESALQQSWPSLEVIVSDDGSTDDSCQIAERYIRRGEPVILLRGHHQGMGGSLNAAFRIATGDVLCLLDADDYFLPGKIQAVLSAFRSQPEAGFAIHRAQSIDSYGRQRGVYPLLQALPRGNCAAATLNNAGVLMGLPPTSSLSLRREAAQCIFPVPEYFSGYAEQMIHRIAPLLTSICAIDEPLSVWRLHGHNDGNSSRVAPERLARELGFMRKLWLEQRNYLRGIDPELPRHLPPLESNALYMRMQYMQLRLTGDPAARECHAALCAIGKPRASPGDLFWRHSLHLPRPLFQRCVDLLQTQSVGKEWVARLLRRRRVARSLLVAGN